MTDPATHQAIERVQRRLANLEDQIDALVDVLGNAANLITDYQRLKSLKELDQ